MTANGLQKQQFQKQVIAAQSRRNRFAAGVKQVMEPGFAQKIQGGTPFTKKVAPLRNAAVQAEVPNGTPVVDLNLANGIAIEQDVTITIDTVALGLTATLVDVVLFDESGLHDALFPYTNPAGTPTMRGSNAFYAAWLGNMCGATYYFDNMLIEVSPAAGAAATAAQQFAQNITRFEHNSRTSQNQVIPVSNYVEPGWFNQSVRTINLNENTARFDRNVAWSLKVYHGMVINITFNVLAAVYGR